MSEPLQLDKDRFKERLKKIQSKIEMPLLAILGRKNELQEIESNSALFIYLTNYEFPETLLLITKEKCYAVTSKKKKDILETLECDNLIIFERMNDGSTDLNIIKELKKITGTVLFCERSKSIGVFCSKFIPVFSKTDYFLGNLFIEKDSHEIQILRDASRFLLYLVKETIRMVKNNEQCIENKLERLLDQPTDFTLLRTMKLSNLEFLTRPEIIMDREAVLIHLSVRYRSYCAQIKRFLFYDEEDLQIYRKRDEVLKNQQFDHLKSIGLLPYEGDRTNEQGVFLLKTGYHGNSLIDMVSFENGEFSVLTDDFGFDQSKKKSYFTMSDFIIERQKTGIEKKRLSRQKQLEKEIEMNEHQRLLMEKLNDQMIEYHSVEREVVSPEKETKKIVFYEKESQLIRKPKIFFDRRNFGLLIPIKSYMVPFHIEYIKNCSLNMNDLRINFKDSEIIKSITFRTKYANMLLQEINDLKREYTEKKEISYVSNQGKLVEKKGRRFLMNNVKIKTENRTLKKNQKSFLELHENGFKFNDLFILFDNIEHLFYQQGDIFLLHFKLKNFIIFNNKKCLNIQFYKEVIENMSVDISKYVTSDKERFEEEQEIIRSKIIKEEFDSFIRNIENTTSLRVDRISREIYFEGVPFRQNVQIRPSSTCLVYLIEPPFLIIDFEKIEIVNFERVNFVSRSFDLTFIYKDKTFISVTSIDSKSMDYLREFIDSRDVCFIQTTQNINWSNLLKTIQEDAISFYKDGGWSSLQPLRVENEMDESTESSISEPSSISEESHYDTDVSESLSTVTENSDDVVDLNEISSDEGYESSESDHKYKKRKQ